MSRHRDIRRCALQVLYQFESGNVDETDAVRSSLDRAPGDEAVHQEGLELAKQAWEARAASDRAVEAIAPKWPVHRQPVVDRSILRLAHFEMFSGRTPPKVAINEAVELAKEFSTDKSPSFVNGVLDKLYRILREEVAEAPPADPGAAAVVHQDLPGGKEQAEH